jgi:hypothetical protein
MREGNSPKQSYHPDDTIRWHNDASLFLRFSQAQQGGKAEDHNQAAPREGNTVQLRFLQGDAQAPKGHAIVFARNSAKPQGVLAVYCVVLPIRFSIGKFIPPILAAQMPPEGLREATEQNCVPIPPMLEESESLEQLERIAELRGDDLCDIGFSVRPDDEASRLTLPAQACEEYARLYTNYANARLGRSELAPGSRQIEGVPLDDLDVETVLGSMLTDRDRLNELAKLIGTARYALEGKDTRALRETEQQMRRTAEPLPEKYKAGELIKSALEPDERGLKLAKLYLERANKLVEEEYAEIPRIERDIRELTTDA